MRLLGLLQKQSGFTLIEITIVIAVLGILSGIGVLRMQDQLENARLAVVDDTVSQVRRMIQNTAAASGRYPTALDNAAAGAASANSPFFAAVDCPVSNNWTKRLGHIYQPSNLRNTTVFYQYNPQDGSFGELSRQINASGPTTINSFLAQATPTQLDPVNHPFDWTTWSYDDYSLAHDAVFNRVEGAMTFDMVFPESTTGKYQLDLSVMNYASHGIPGRENLTVPPDYKFKFDVQVGGGAIQHIEIPASDVNFQTGSLIFTGVAAGAGQVQVKWTNDSCYGDYDANAMVKNLVITPL